jgi:membrane-associated phospholipid phosphatase
VKLESDILNRSHAFRITVGFILAAIFLLIAGLLSQAGVFSSFDLAVREQVAALERPLITICFLAITKFGSTVYLFVFGSIFALVLIWLRQWNILGLFLLAMLGEAILSNGFKFAFAMPRPEPLVNYVMEDSKSFPSGHALASTAFYGFLAIAISRRTRVTHLPIFLAIASVTLISLVSFSRVYIGVHRPSDVLSGIIAAAIWTAAITSIINKYVTDDK